MLDLYHVAYALDHGLPTVDDDDDDKEWNQ